MKAVHAFIGLSLIPRAANVLSTLQNTSVAAMGFHIASSLLYYLSAFLGCPVFCLIINSQRLCLFIHFLCFYVLCFFFFIINFHYDSLDIHLLLHVLIFYNSFHALSSLPSICSFIWLKAQRLEGFIDNIVVWFSPFTLHAPSKLTKYVIQLHRFSALRCPYWSSTLYQINQLHDTCSNTIHINTCSSFVFFTNMNNLKLYSSRNNYLTNLKSSDDTNIYFIDPKYFSMLMSV